MLAKITILGNPRSKKNSMKIVHARSNGNRYGNPRSKKNSTKSAQVRSKGNRYGRSFIVQGDAWNEYEKSAVFVGEHPREPIATPVNVKMVFHRETKIRVDLSNLEAGCLDLLVKRGVLADDNCDVVVSQDGSRVIKGVGKGNGRVEVEITEASR